MKNAKDELIKKIGKANIVWARMYYYDESTFFEEENDNRHSVVLAPNHTKEEEENFFNSLNFNYSDGYGTQWVYGTVMLDDDSWLERGEYDGAEWWERRRKPQW